MPLSKQMSELVTQICAEKNLDKKLILVEELKRLLNKETELLKSQALKQSA